MSAQPGSRFIDLERHDVEVAQRCFATALGFALTAPSYAAHASQSLQTTRSAAWSDTQIHDAMEQCKNLTATARAQCIVNIRPAPGRKSVGATPGSAPNADTVKDRAGERDAEYAAALKECESMNAADKERCVNSARERFG